MKARIGLLLGGILAGLLLCELAVRALGLAPAVAVLSKGRFRLSSNPRLAYEPIPDLEYGGESLDGYQYRDRSNRLGYRGPGYAVAKPPGTRRIAVLGDSIAEGMRLASYDYVFSARVEKQLRAHGLAVEVLNFAVSGYNTQQKVETLKEKGVPYEPDLVVLAYCLNDRESPYFFLLDPLLREARTWKGSRVSSQGLGAFSEHAYVRGLAEAQGFHWLDLLDVFRECGAQRPKPISKDILHPSAYGHACAAAAITDYVERRVFLRPDQDPGAAGRAAPQPITGSTRTRPPPGG